MGFLLCKCQGKKPLSLVHFANLCHIFIAQCKVKNIKIIFHVLWIGRFGENDVALLNVPTQDDLSIALAVFLSKL